MRQRSSFRNALNDVRSFATECNWRSKVLPFLIGLGASEKSLTWWECGAQEPHYEPSSGHHSLPWLGWSLRPSPPRS